MVPTCLWHPRSYSLAPITHLSTEEAKSCFLAAFWSGLDTAVPKQFGVQYPGYQLPQVTSQLRTSVHDRRDALDPENINKKPLHLPHYPSPISPAHPGLSPPFCISFPTQVRATQYYAPKYCLAEGDISISIIPLEGMHICWACLA